MFSESPLLTLIIFGFPFGVISIVCYFLCCVDSTDQSDPEDAEYSDSEGEDEDEHQFLLNEAAGQIENEENNLNIQTNNDVHIDPDKKRMKPVKVSKKTQ